MDTSQGNQIPLACRNGHPRTPENTYLLAGRSPSCRACNAIAVSKYKKTRPRKIKQLDGPVRRKRSAKPKLRQMRVTELFAYSEDSPTGLVWAFRTGPRSPVGAKAGSIKGGGYYSVGHLDKRYRCHRVVWELHYGQIPEGLVVDHINGVRTDNRISNLRLATKAQNAQNQSVQRHNTTGVKGLSRHQGGWVGRIRCSGERYEFFSRVRAEVEVWLIETREKLHGQFAKH